jgi:transposase
MRPTRRLSATRRCAPRQRFVDLRSIDNQVAVMRHRVREQLVGQRTALLNVLRGHLSKIGLVTAQSPTDVSHGSNL